MEDFWIKRAQDAEAQVATIEAIYKPALEKVKLFKLNFGVQERQDGTIDINFPKFVESLGIEQALVLREQIDEQYNVSGEPGKKPHLKLVADAD